MTGPSVPGSWNRLLAHEIRQPYHEALREFVAAERARTTVYPPETEVYEALRCTSYSDTRVLLLGQDPYHDENQAHGLCFSVRPGVRPPRSLVNIFRELRDDLGCPIPDNGYLIPWANQGVLMLNTVLTVRAHEAGSHRGKGWERFTDAIIRLVNEKEERVVFVLWGAQAAAKLPLIDTTRHAVVQGAHPSPLSARRGFFGSRPFSAINDELAKGGPGEPIDWRIPNLFDTR